MCSVKKDVLRNLTKFTEKHLCQSLFFNKVAGLRRSRKPSLTNSDPSAVLNKGTTMKIKAFFPRFVLS